MIYGFTVIKEYTSKDWWDTEKYRKVSKVRLFDNEKSRDNAMEIEHKNNKGKWYDIEILPFQTKSSQGRIKIEKTYEKKQNKGNVSKTLHKGNC